MGISAIIWPILFDSFELITTFAVIYGANVGAVYALPSVVIANYFTDMRPSSLLGIYFTFGSPLSALLVLFTDSIISRLAFSALTTCIRYFTLAVPFNFSSHLYLAGTVRFFPRRHGEVFVAFTFDVLYWRTQNALKQF